MIPISSGRVETVSTVLVVQERHPVRDRVVPATGAVVTFEMQVRFFGVYMISAGRRQVGSQVLHAGDDGRVIYLCRSSAGPHMALADTNQQELI